MKNLLGQDMTKIEEFFHDAGRDLVKATKEGRYYGEERANYNLWQSVFHIAMYQTVEKAWEYWERYKGNAWVCR